jgi:hypothetical protein
MSLRQNERIVPLRRGPNCTQLHHNCTCIFHPASGKKSMKARKNSPGLGNFRGRGLTRPLPGFFPANAQRERRFGYASRLKLWQNPI